MHFPKPFYRLPLNFDYQRLLEEISLVDETDWITHPSNFTGNTALILASAFGEDNHDNQGEMLLTPRVKNMPYVQQVMASFNTVVGRARLMRLEPGCSVNRHTDIAYYWYNRMRLHIPIVTDPAVRFICEDTEVHMAPGEAWTFDNWRYHEVVNDSDITRIHLVIDTVGTPELWNMLEKESWYPDNKNNKVPEWFKPKNVDYVEGYIPELKMEKYNVQGVLPPSDVDIVVSDYLRELNRKELGEQDTQLVENQLHTLRRGWRSLWAQYGGEESSKPYYEKFLLETLSLVKHMNPAPRLEINDTLVAGGLISQLGASLVKETNTSLNPGIHVAADNTEPLKKENQLPSSPEKAEYEVFDRPVIIVSAPRTGSTLLYETLANNRMFWDIDGESHGPIEGIADLNPRNRGFSSNKLDASDATPEIISRLKKAFFGLLKSSDGDVLSKTPVDQRPETIRFLEKTPKNALRIPFLQAVFPDAKFIYLYRRPEENISSIMEGWKSGRYATYQDLPNWHGEYAWSYLLPEGWREVSGKPLAEVAWFQYKAANEAIMHDLKGLGEDKVAIISYDDFLENKLEVLKRLCEFADVPFGPKMQALCEKDLPLSRFTLDAPEKDKWRKNEEAMSGILDAARDFYEIMKKYSV